MQTISMGVAAVKILEIELCFIENLLRVESGCVVFGSDGLGSTFCGPDECGAVKTAATVDAP